MGSLVPGWDAELQVPRELTPDNIDIDKEPEPEGYFARLKSHRRSAGGDEPVSLARSSAPLARTSTGPHTPPKQQHPPHVLRTTSTLSSTAAHHAETDAAARHRLPHPEPPHKYPFTDWAEELATLRPLKRTSLTGAEERQRSPGAEVPHPEKPHSAGWWRSLEVGHLNEQPDTADAAAAEGAACGHGHGHSTFTPQFTPSLQRPLDYGEREGAGGA